MTTHPLTLDRVNCRLPDGRALFSELSFTFDPVPTGLVGANGVGKSVLTRVLAGQHAPSAGRCQGGGRVVLLPTLSGLPQGCVADLAGVADVLDALARITHGSIDPDDFSCAEGRWDLREQLLLRWQRDGLPADLRPEDPASRLSGGQAMQVALSAAWASGADWLILDEPSNPLDARRRTQLRAALRRWRRGLLVVSHDRALLGLDSQRIERPAATLSAGERLKAAMACTLYRAPAPGLLLLDEPGNGLDLPALQVLEDLLGQYTGTVVMTSHDPHLLQALRPTHALRLTAMNAPCHPTPS